MALSFDLFWSFRSPYSYLVTSRLLDLTQEHDVDCCVRPVFPLAIRTPEFFDGRDPQWFQYFRIDVHREADYLGLPLRWPQPDPVYRENGNYRVSQPYIHRLTYLGVAAAERGRGLPFLNEVGHLIWSGEVDGWNEGSHLAEAAARVGLDLAELDAAIASDTAHYAAIVEESQLAQREAGHWGVPLMVFDGEPFFGQDRFDQMKWRMEAKGLERR